MKRPASCASCDRRSSQQLCSRCLHARELLTRMPLELLTAVFLRLAAPDLLRVRSSCRSWKRIVDGSSALRGRIVARFQCKAKMDDSFDPGMPAAARAVIECTDVARVASWWPAFGERLVSLELTECRISLGTLFGMLRGTPVLRELMLDEVTPLNRSDGKMKEKFRLGSLEKLYLDACFNKRQSKFYANMIDLFCEICPKLKYFVVSGFTEYDSIVKMITAAESTLKGIKFDATPKTVEALSKLNLLKLSHITILHCESYDRNAFAKLFRAQPNVTGLSVPHEAVQFLNQLEFTQLHLVRLKIELDQSCKLRIGHMPTLEHLEITAYYSGTPRVDFINCRTPNLKELRFFGTHFVGKSAAIFLASCPKLQLLRFAQVIIENSMNLSTLSQPFNAMRTLKVDQANVPQKLLLDLFRLCPNLETLELSATMAVDDGVVRDLCQQLRHLKRLSLACWIRDATASHILNLDAKDLRRLEYHDVWELQANTKRKLVEHFSPRCAVKFGAWKTSETYHLDLMDFF